MAFWGHSKGKKKEKTEDEKEREMEENYCKIIDEAAEKKMNFEIHHSVRKHTAYILKTLFMHAENEVCIITYGLNEAIFKDDSLNDSLIMEAVKFLNRHEAKLKIAYKDKEVLSGEFLKSVLNVSAKGKVEIWDASKVTQINDSYIWLSDSYCFAIGPQNARANFGNKEVGQNFANFFIRTIIKSEKVLS